MHNVIFIGFLLGSERPYVRSIYILCPGGKQQKLCNLVAWLALFEESISNVTHIFSCFTTANLLEITRKNFRNKFFFDLPLLY